MDRLEALAAAHARLKRRIHAFRVPIKSRAGLFAVSCLYFSVPLVAGWHIMKWSNARRDENLGERREKLERAAEQWGTAPMTAAGARAVAPPRRAAPPPASPL